MKELINKLLSIERETSVEKGAYNLFALFFRGYFPRKWDLLVAASWIDDRGEGLRYLASKIQSSLSKEEFMLINSIYVIESFYPALPELQEEIDMDVEHGTVELKNFEFDGIEVKRAFIITSKKRQAA